MRCSCSQDSPDRPRQIASLAILEPGEHPLDYDRLIHVINERIDLVPRYRQVPRTVPASLGTPVWVDDENFDISLHVRRSALPRPGSALRAARARRPADRPSARSRPAALGALPDRGAVRRSSRPALQGPPGIGRRIRDGRPRAGAARGDGSRSRHPPRGVEPSLRAQRRRARRRLAQPQPAPSRRGPAGRRAQPRPPRPPSPGDRRSTVSRPTASCRPTCRGIAGSPRWPPSSTTSAASVRSTAARSTT